MSKPGLLSLVAALVLLAVVTAFGMKARWHSKARNAAGAPTGADLPAYTSENKLMLPANYREWVFLSSGFGMNYSNGGGSHPMFTNVYASPEAYRGFKSSGKWPDKSMFVVEIYSPATGSINKSGYFQNQFKGLDVEVKDSSQKDEWTYYNFSPGDRDAAGMTGSCSSCHSEHAAVEHTFVQFYPTLLEFAREKRLLKPGVAVR
ncbi:MAG TPA: cytochrome P460 family protein [Candidatus Angelobacter sp.]|nr:cytochrome P460 family protein [Candidatus Angelobacter sp.]